MNDYIPAPQGVVTITNLDGVTLERHTIAEQNDQKASDKRATLLNNASTKYGRGKFYLFAEWFGSQCIQPTYMLDGRFTPRRALVSA
jgi:hypothetical protein